jgi:hypothetical protein
VRLPGLLTRNDVLDMIGQELHGQPPFFTEIMFLVSAGGVMSDRVPLNCFP